MEPSYFERLIQFIKSSFQEKFKAFMPGCIMGMLGSQHILWIGVPISLVEGVLKVVATITMAFGSGLATSYAAYLVEQYKKKKDAKIKQKKRQNGKAA